MVQKRKLPIVIAALAIIFLFANNLLASSSMEDRLASRVCDEDDPCDTLTIEPDTLDICAYDIALPFNFEGNILNTSGYYTYHYETAQGCDSTVVVHFQVLSSNGDSREEFRRVTICSHELPYIEQDSALTTPGMYKFHTPAQNGCDSAYYLLLAVKESPVVILDGGGYLCPGALATLTVEACNQCSYEWSTGDHSLSITTDSAGVYYMTATNTNNCSVTDSVVLAAAQEPDAQIVGDTVCCFGSSLSLSVSGSFDYIWDNGISGPITVTPDQDTTIRVTIYDRETFCSKQDSILIHVSPNPTAFISSNTLEICSGDSTLLTASGGVRFLWSTGDTTASIYVQEEGIYSVVVVNEFGCSDSTSVNIVVHPVPIVTISGNTSFCSDESTTITLSGASSYVWSNGNRTSTLSTNIPGDYSVTCTNDYGCRSIITVPLTISTVEATLSGSNTYCQGSYTVLRVMGDSTNTYQWVNGTTADSIIVSSIGIVSVIVTNSIGCQKLLSTNINELPAPNPSISVTQGELIICEGRSVSLRASGGFSYQWSNGRTTNIITVTEQGTYTVTVTSANGCSAAISESVIVNSKPQITILAPDTSCAGNEIQIHAISPTGTSYSWSSGQATSSISVQPGVGLSYYMVTVVDNNGCSNTASTTIAVVAKPSVFINGLNNSTITICQNEAASLYATTGASYQWSNGMSTNPIFASNVGTYSVTVTNHEGCSSSASVTIASNPLPVATITENTAICQGQTATLSATYNSSYTYHWSTGSNTNSIVTSTAGTYAVTVTNANGCSNVLSTTLTVNEKPQVSISGSTSICAGEMSQLTATANMPCSYVWSTGDTNSITSVGSSNTYRVTAYNANGCSNTASLAVTVHPLPIPYITGNTTICKGTSTTLTANGGVSYMWSNGHTSAQISVSPSSNLTYTVTATDQYNCRGVMSATVTVNIVPSINILGNRSFCEGGSTTLTASGGSYYTWSTGDNTASVNISTVGTYSVTATNSLGCQNYESVTVTVMSRPYISISGRSSICLGEMDTLVAGGASQYIWSTGESSSTIHVMPTTTTTYTVTGTGYNGCTATVSKVVNISERPTIQINGVTNICEGESTTLTAIGGVSYQWANGSTSNQIEVTQSGNYAVIGTNAAGCSNSSSQVVTVNPVPRITLTGSTTFCENTTSTIMVDGGSSYHWSTGSGQSAITLSSGGTYSVTAYNVYGCSSDTSFQASTWPTPEAVITGTTDLCEGESGYLTVSENAHYTWSNGSTAQTINITPYESTSYYVTVTDNNGCNNYTYKSVAVHQTHHNYFTAEICQGQSFSQYGFNIPAQNEAGVFTFTDSLQSQYGCDSLSTLTLTVNPTPIINGGILGYDNISNYGQYYYHIIDVENATIFEWSITNPRWALSSSNINSVFIDILSPGSGTLIVKAINSCGYQDTSLAITCNVGVEEYLNESEIVVYPNPVSQSLHINLEKTVLEVSEIQLFDPRGRCVHRIPVDDNLIQLDCTPYANGHYVIRFVDDKGRVLDSRKIIINK